MSSAIEHISDTALWVAVYRAMESERPDAHFRDPYARRLAGERGEEIVRRMPQGTALAWPMIVRTAVMDELILRAIVRDRVDAVVNLAAGLDTRPYRLSLPRSLHWMDVDLPAILDYKQQALQGERPACDYEPVRLDLTDREARRSLIDGMPGERILVITEGLLIYLTAAQVGSLAADLHERESIRWWLTDLGSPRLLKMLERTWNKHLTAAGSPLQFAPAEGTAFFQPHGWRESEFRSSWEESHRLKREMPRAWIWRPLSRLMPARLRDEYRRISGVALLQRDELTVTQSA